MTKPSFVRVSCRPRARHAYGRRSAFLALLLAVGLVAGGCKSLRMGRSGPQGLDGAWAATLNPDAVPIDVSMTLNSGEGGLLTGSVGAASIDGGKYSGEGDGSTIEFQTGAITVQGPTGEITREGPLMWTATLRGGMLDGTVTDAEGRSARWTAQREATSAATAPARSGNSCQIQRRSVASGR